MLTAEDIAQLLLSLLKIQTGGVVIDADLNTSLVVEGVFDGGHVILAQRHISEAGLAGDKGALGQLPVAEQVLVHVNRLRQRLVEIGMEDVIITKKGLGYMAVEK